MEFGVRVEFFWEKFLKEVDNVMMLENSDTRKEKEREEARLFT